MKTTPETRATLREYAEAGVRQGVRIATTMCNLLDDFDEAAVETARLRNALEAATDALEHSPYADHQEAHDAAVEALHPKEPTP
jgi:hypothetical protein